MTIMFLKLVTVKMLDVQLVHLLRWEAMCIKNPKRDLKSFGTFYHVHPISNSEKPTEF